jgi:hypothetical protein
MHGVRGTPTTTRTPDRKRAMILMDDEVAAAAPEAAVASSILPRRVSLDETHLQPDVLANLIIPSSTSSDEEDDNRDGDDDSHDVDLEELDEEDILSWVGSCKKRQRLLVPVQEEVPPGEVVAPSVPDEAVVLTERSPKKHELSRTTTTNSGGKNDEARHHHYEGADENNGIKRVATTLVVVVANDNDQTQKKTKAVNKLLRFVAMPTLVGRAAAVDDPLAVWYSRPELAALRDDCRVDLLRYGGRKVAAEIMRWYNDDEYGDEDDNNYFNSTDDHVSSSLSSPSDATTRRKSQKNMVHVNVMSADWIELRGLERWTSQVLYHVRQMASQTLRSELYICQSSQRCGCSDCSSCSSGQPSSRSLSCPLTEHPHHVDHDDDDTMATCSCGGGIEDDAASSSSSTAADAEQRLAEISRTHSARAVMWARRLAQFDAAVVVVARRPQTKNIARSRPIDGTNHM